jgi:hypothetical protein
VRRIGEYSDQGVEFPWMLAEQCVLLKRGLEEVGQIRLESEEFASLRLAKTAYPQPEGCIPSTLRNQPAISFSLKSAPGRAKFQKSRLVPLHKSALQELRTYIERRFFAERACF